MVKSKVGIMVDEMESTPEGLGLNPEDFQTEKDSDEAHYHWSTQTYIDKVEHSTNPLLQEYQKTELDYITTGVENLKGKTFIDVGAGYGRVVPHMSRIAGQVIGVEIDPNMLQELGRKAQEFSNAQVVEGDANSLSKLLESKEIRNPLSKWWTPEDRSEITELINGQKVNEILRPGFYIIHISYKTGSGSENG